MARKRNKDEEVTVDINVYCPLCGGVFKESEVTISRGELTDDDLERMNVEVLGAGSNLCEDCDRAVGDRRVLIGVDYSDGEGEEGKGGWPEVSDYICLVPSEAVVLRGLNGTQSWMDSKLIYLPTKMGLRLGIFQEEVRIPRRVDVNRFRSSCEGEESEIEQLADEVLTQYNIRQRHLRLEKEKKEGKDKG